MPTKSRPVSLVSGEADTLHAFGEEVSFHLVGAQTGGKFALWTEVTPPGGGPPLHLHFNEDELFVVQEGNVSFIYDDEWHDLGPGGVAFMPRESIHTFKNVGDAPSRMLIETSPAGFETFFGRCAEEFKKPAGPDLERINGIAAEHGIRFLGP